MSDSEDIEVRMSSEEEEDGLPEFVRELSPQSVAIGEKLEMMVEICSATELMVKWLCNDEELLESENITLSSEDNYSFKCFIASCESKHAGSYICIAENSAGQSTSCAEMEVLDVQVTVGESEDAEIAAADSDIDFIDENEDHEEGRAQPDQECERVPEQMTIDLNDIQSLALTDNQLEHSEHASAQTPTGPQRTPQRVPYSPPAEDSDMQINIKVTNPSKKQNKPGLSKPQLPKGKPVRIVQHLRAVEALVGGPACLECLVSSSDSNVEASWYRGGAQLVSSSNYLICKEGNRHFLSIPEVFSEDTGEYSIKVKNPYGEDMSIATLKVKDPALRNLPPTPPLVSDQKLSFIQPLENIEGREGHPICLVCKVQSGRERIEVSWYKDDQSVDQDPNYNFSFAHNIAMVTIPEAFPEDSGRWMCLARSSKGSITTRCILKVHEAQVNGQAEEPKPVPVSSEGQSTPEISSHLRPQHLVEGGQAVLECQATGGGLTVTWFKSDKRLQPTHRHRMHQDDSGVCILAISPLLVPEDYGMYTCLVNNNFGEAVTSAPLLDDVDYEAYLNELKRQEFVGELSTKVYEHKSKKKEKRPVYVPKYEQNLNINVEKRLSSLSSHDDERMGQGFKISNFESRLLKEVDYRKGAIPSSSSIQSPDSVFEAPVSGDGEPPVIVRKPEPLEIIEGSTARFECQLTGVPTPRICWYHNGEDIPISHRLSMGMGDGGVAYLNINMTFPDDAGYYTLLAVNRNGKATCSTQLSFKEGYNQEKMNAFRRLEEKPKKVDRSRAGVYEKFAAPVFIQTPNDVTVREGRPLRLDCRVQGRPQPSLSWYRDGDLISPAECQQIIREDGTHSLFIAHCTSAHTGRYRCLAQNRGGESCFELQVSVEEKMMQTAPKFLERLFPIRVSEGEKIFIQARLSGTPEPIVFWSRNSGKPVENGRSEVLPGGIHTLTIDRCSRSDGGWYSCSARSPAGFDTATCKVEILYSKPLMDQGSEPEFKVRIPKRNKLNSLEILQRMETPQLPPSYVKQAWSDEDLYQASKPKAPKFKKVPADHLHLNEGDKVYLECTVVPAGDPSMQVEWFRDGRPILHGSRMRPIFEFGFCVLEFDDVFGRDSGVYTCRAINRVGVAQTNVRIFVQETGSLVQESQLPEEMRGGFQQLNYLENLATHRVSGDLDDSDILAAPKIIQYPEHASIVEGMSAKFICRIVGNPPPKIFWFKNDAVLKESKRVRMWEDGICHLEMQKCRKHDSGRITVFAENSMGQVRFDANLVVNAKAVSADTTAQKTESLAMQKFVKNYENAS